MKMDTQCQGLTIWTSEKIVTLPRGVFLSSFCSCSSLLPANDCMHCHWATSLSQLPAEHWISLLKSGLSLYWNQWDLLILHFWTAIGLKYIEDIMCTAFFKRSETWKKKRMTKVSLCCQHFTACRIYVLFTHIKTLWILYICQDIKCSIDILIPRICTIRKVLYLLFNTKLFSPHNCSGEQLPCPS